MKKRASNLSGADVVLIEAMILKWQGPLRWEGLIERIKAEPQLGQVYTRQALQRHPELAAAFQKRRRTPLAPKVYPSLELEAAAARIERLEVREAKHNTIVAGYKERFGRWAYNARLRGITEAELDMPLEPIDRSQTILKPGRTNPLDEDGE
jgi:hypothetical protein